MDKELNDMAEAAQELQAALEDLAQCAQCAEGDPVAMQLVTFGREVLANPIFRALMDIRNARLN